MPAKIAKEDLLADIRRVADELEKEPSKADYNEHGEYSTYPAQTKFGSWTDAKEAAGVDVNRQNEYVPKVDVLADLERVAESVDGPISKEVYNEHGEYHPATLFKRCGSILEALDEIGLLHRVGKAPNGIDEERVLEDIHNVAETVGHAPSRNEYAEHGQFSHILPRIKFGSWSEARQQAGFDSGPTQNTWLDKQILKDEIHRVAEIVGKSPSQSQFNEYADFSHTVVWERFGSWNNALKECGLETRYDERLPDERMLGDIRRVGRRIERVPSQTKYHEHGSHGLTTVKRHFGKWSTAVRKAGFEPHTVGPGTGEDNPAWNGGYEPYYGPNWYEQRRKARKRDGHKCVDCGLNDEEHKEKYGWELEVHHIQRANSFGDDYEAMNALSNLVTLCRSHHREYEELPANECEKLKS